MLIIKNKKMLKNEITENEALSIARVSGSTFVNADCFDVFPFIEDKSIDAIICDLPYGTTACKWVNLHITNRYLCRCGIGGTPAD